VHPPDESGTDKNGESIAEKVATPQTSTVVQRHRKPTGLRTLSLVSLGSALAVLTIAQDPQADITRVIQGVITAVGFIGAGVILQGPSAPPL
jgi:hypothetical protein